MELSSISIKIIVKDENKSTNRHCLKKTLQKYKKANIENPNKNGCSTKKSAAKKSKHYIKKKSTKGLKSFDKELNIAEPSNTRKKVSNIFGAVFHSTSKRF